MRQMAIWPVAFVLCLGACQSRDVAVSGAVPDAGAGADAGVPDAAGGDGGTPWTVASTKLAGGWKLQSSEAVPDTGDVISSPSYRPEGWYDATVPSTVFAALVANGVYPDPFFGTNLRSVPGMGYPVGENFSNYDMPDDSPFRVKWWYRAAFDPGTVGDDQQVWLRFRGLNYAGRIYVNGKRISRPGDIEGAFRHHEFNVTGLAEAGGGNAVAVEVAPPKVNDLGITFIDWNPAPPDKNMGLWNDVEMSLTGPVAIRHPHVVTALDPPSGATARLSVTARLVNGSSRDVSGTLRGTIGGAVFSQDVALAAREEKQVVFDPASFPELVIANPHLWWPWELGPQELYDMELVFETGGRVSDRQAIRFGIREVKSEFTADGHRLFFVNFRKVLIRGAGYAPDMLLRFSPERDEAEVGYVKHMNLNAIRLEGKLGNTRLLDLCDKQGIMVIAGWCCCDFWEEWHAWNEGTYEIAAASQRDQIREIRNHPSVIAWLNASDRPPVERAEKAYLEILEEERWPNPVVSSADDRPADFSGPSGVKMTGPYEWVPPHYWLSNKDRGGAFGFNTETSPGPAVPPLESLKRMLPEDHLWPIGSTWNYHAGGGVFGDLLVFTEAMSKRHGAARDAADYAAKSQLMAYEGIRAMFEAYGGRKYTSTGVIQWMLNNAWPGVIWHLYDYYLKPGGGYFGARKACEPLHVQYHYDDRTVVVVNSTYGEHKGVKVTARLFNIDLSESYSHEETVDIGPDAAVTLFAVPEPPDLSTTYFLRLGLEEPGKTPAHNLYWLSTKPDVLDDENAEWYYTPTKEFADLTGINDLPAAAVEVSATVENDGTDEIATITLENTTDRLAFFVRVEVTRGQGGEEVLPILWSDNYVTLWPGESVTLTAKYESADVHGLAPYLRVEGYNVPKVETPIP
ncbi:MAG: glycosyl hydrolase family 2 [Deltaproteobacteria bacterium]|nr:glycosyl hydrolase family 2 [Deltaproteobacteria bacterium]